MKKLNLNEQINRIKELSKSINEQNFENEYPDDFGYEKKSNDDFNSLISIKSVDDLKDNIGKIFIATAFIPNLMDSGRLQKGGEYKLRKVFDDAKFASFDELDDRSADAYKYNKLNIQKVHFDDIFKWMKLKNNNNEDNIPSPGDEDYENFDFNKYKDNVGDIDSKYDEL